MINTKNEHKSDMSRIMMFLLPNKIHCLQNDKLDKKLLITPLQ